MLNKINQNEFEVRLKNKFPSENIEILSYVKMSGPCRYKCAKCKQEFQIYKASDLLLKKHLCNNCWYSIGNGEKTKEYKEQALELIKKDNNKELVEFGYNKKLMKPTIKFKCLKCESISELQLIYFINHHSCPHCAYNAKHLTTDGVKLRIPEEFTLLEDYTGTDDKILVRHENCGFIWKTTVHGLLSDYRCPKCSKKRSKGEQNIIKWLNNNNINFSAEQIFSWSKNRRYDFYIPDYNLLIEYMGIQHYEEIPFFTKTLKEQQEIDKEKEKMALLNGFNYLVISYKDYQNIEAILAQRLSRKESSESETESTLLG